MTDLIKKRFAEFTGLGIFVIYLFTMAPSVIQIDSGELAAVQSTLGIAHPTGYPLFTLTGYLFLQIPLPVSTIIQANLLAVIFCSVTTIFFTKSIYLILNNPERSTVNSSETQTKKNTIAQLDETAKITIAVLGGLILAFSETFWMQSTSVEVYSLHILLLSITIYFLLKIHFIKKNSIKNWLVITFLLALGFTNHMTTLLIIPSVIYLFFLHNRFDKEGLKKLILMAAAGLVILILFYSYLPLRAGQNPSLNWGNPVNLENIVRHISGKQYQVWIFSSFDAAGEQLKYFAATLPAEFGYAAFILALAGLFYGYRYHGKIFYFFVIAFGATVFYSINYDISDIDSYFLLAYMAVSVFAVWGILYFVEKIRSDGMNKNFITAAFIVIPLLSFVINFNKTDQSNMHTFEDYTKTILHNVEENSMIFGYQWDYFISPSYYFQYSEGYRSDVKVIDKELLRRSWYFVQMETNFPEAIDDSKDEINSFLKVLEPFENDEPYDGRIIEQHFRKMMTSLVRENLTEREVYITHEIFANEMQRGEFSLPEGYTLVPHLLAYKVVPVNSGYAEAPLPGFEIRFPENQNNYTEFIYNMCGMMLINRALYELQFGYNDRAKIYYDKVRSGFPNYNIPFGAAEQLKSLK